jgi:hypothetical protein
MPGLVPGMSILVPAHAMLWQHRDKSGDDH